MIIFHDVDGCLNSSDGLQMVSSGNALQPHQREALRELGRLLDASAVSDFVLNTGRGWHETGFLVEAIASEKLRFAIVEHGALLWDVNAHTTIDLQALASGYGFDDVASSFHSVHRVRELISWYQDTGGKLLSEALNHEVTLPPHGAKVASLTLNVPAELSGDTVLACLRGLIESQPDFATNTFSYHHSVTDGFVDVTGEVDKGTGVKVVTRYLDGNSSDTVGVGNGLNDLPMLETVSLPICPANAEEPVKTLCGTNGHVSDHDYIGATLTWLHERFD